MDKTLLIDWFHLRNIWIARIVEYGWETFFIHSKKSLVIKSLNFRAIGYDKETVFSETYQAMIMQSYSLLKLAEVLESAG